MKTRHIFIFLSLIFLILILTLSWFWKLGSYFFILYVPIVGLGMYDIFQKKHSILRNYPVVGHFRYLLESFRSEIQQYFVETETQGTPINRQFRSLVYSRAKSQNDTTPFGSKFDMYKAGYEFMTHSMYPKNKLEMNFDPRVSFGGKDCKQPYSASILNISAMSFGSLSKNAILALSKGANKGGFAHNTGEGGLSPYHIEGGGDLIWQIGTGYFGCRNKDGNFDDEKFALNANHAHVKMIEIKLSQGAKPGHGGILPASKNSVEISKIRGVEPHTDVHSPAYHTAFTNATEMMHFIKKLRDLSNGKPVGFKLCVGNKEEFIELCEAMVKTKIYPDFITVDGGEGGTGAAPVEFTNSMGMPLREGLWFVFQVLRRYGLKDEIKLIASGKVLSAFHMIRLMSLGADTINCARAMMLAIGCIHALKCNTNTCPVGVATQDPALTRGLDVESKHVRVANFHDATIHAFVELLVASGLSDISKLRRKHIYHRKGPNKLVSYEEIYPEEFEH